MFSTRKQREDETNEVPVWTGTKANKKEEKSINGAGKERAQVNLATIIKSITSKIKFLRRKLTKTVLQPGSLKIRVLLTRYNSHHTKYNLDNQPEDLFNNSTDITNTHVTKQSFSFKIATL